MAATLLAPVPVPAPVPKKIFAIPCPDKLGQETWNAGRSLMNIPCPARIALIGPPNSGKTSLVKNLILHAEPCYNLIMLRASIPGSREYEDVKAKSLEAVPNMEDLEGDIKKVMIIEDCKLKTFPKDERAHISNLLSYGSSHCGITVIICCQSLTDIPIELRRCINLYVLFKPNNMNDCEIIARQIGEKPAVLKNLVAKHLKERFQTLWFDQTGCPSPFRKNGFEVLEAP